GLRPRAAGSPSLVAAAGAAGPAAPAWRPRPGTPPGAAAAPPSTPPRSGRRSDRRAGPPTGTAWAGGGCRSWRRLLAPDDADRLQLPGHRPPRAVEPLGDL